MDSPLSILGSIASISAAVWAFVEAKKSAKSASQAESMRDAIYSRRRLVEVSHVYTETKRVLTVAAEVGPATNPKRLRGVDSTRIARELDEYARLLLDQSSHFSADFGNDARALCDRLKPDIQGLAEASTPEEKKTFGTNIYYNVSAFMPIAKQLVDEQRDQSLTTQHRGAK